MSMQENGIEYMMDFKRSKTIVKMQNKKFKFSVKFTKIVLKGGKFFTNYKIQKFHDINFRERKML